MAWPDNLSTVRCEGFSNVILPALKRAIEDGRAEWADSTISMFAGFSKGQFHFADCTWELEEQNELVNRIKLINGNPSAEFLTYAVLRG